MKSGFAYASVGVYRVVMRLLYGKAYDRKYRSVADLIPRHATVVDLCAGDCRLAGMLQGNRVSYVGLELNPKFVKWAQKSGINATVFDARNEEIPEADVICIQSSLYQFIPEDDQLLKRMIRSARQLVIISEPVVNVTSSSNSLLSRLAIRATAVNGRSFPTRHSIETLKALLDRTAPSYEFVESKGRDALFIIRTSPPDPCQQK